MSIDLDELEDANEGKPDFRRANGAPMVTRIDDPEKWDRYSRPSSYAKVLDDEEGLQSWKIWKAMEGVARSPALQHEVVATKDEDRSKKETLRNKAMDKGQASESADKGHALHAMTVRAEDVTDVEWDPPEWVQPDLNAYLDMLQRYGLVSEMFEQPFVNDNYRAAGTADRLWRLTKVLIAPNGSELEPGELIIGDLKTGKKLDFSLPGFCVQTALYATGVLYDVVTNRRQPTPPINQRWTLIAHMPVGTGRCDLRWSPVDVGLMGATLARDVKEWRKLWKNGTYDAPIVEDPKTPTEMLDEITVLASETIDIDVMAAYCQQRINTIGQYEAAKNSLLLHWPDGLPTPKKGLTSAEQVVTLLNLLDRIEADHSVPWTAPDPRWVHMKGHRDTMDRSNEFMLTS